MLEEEEPSANGRVATVDVERGMSCDERGEAWVTGWSVFDCDSVVRKCLKVRA